MNDIVAYTIILLLIVAFFYGLIKQVEETIYVIKSKKAGKYY